MQGPTGAANMRSVSTLVGTNVSTITPKLKSPRVEEMLTGFYQSSNPNLHDFRRPPGKITSDHLIKNQSGMGSVSRRPSH